MVVWTDLDASVDGSAEGIFAQRFDSAGSPAGTEFQVNTYTTGGQSYPPAVAATTAGFVVVWRSKDQDGDDDGVFGQRYDSAGQTAGTEFQINTQTTGAQWFPRVAAGPSGSFVVVWQGNNQDGDWDGVFGQRFGSAAACGNSVVDGGEQCDDGDPEEGDGCDSNCTTSACGNGIIVSTAGEACDDGNIADGDGCSSTCQDSAVAENTADAELTAGETISSDAENDGATVADPIETSITMSVGTAAITIAEASGSDPVPGFSLIGQQTQIDFDCPGAPCPSPTAPLALSFRIDASRIPSGIDETNLAVLRDGALVPACSGGPGIASPDPCVSERELFVDGDVGVTILTSQASLWAFASATCSPAPLTCDDPGKAILLVKKSLGDPSATKLLWKWNKGSISGPSAFGDPLDATSYALCVYDGATLVQSHVVGSNGTCGTSPCWKTLGSKGFGYKNATGNANGITKLLLKSGAGSAKILVKGKGGNLVVPDSDPIYAQSSPVTVQLVSSGGSCWETSYSSPAKKTTVAQFKDIFP
jgi:cysteine-rich repeat protein